MGCIDTKHTGMTHVILGQCLTELAREIGLNLQFPHDFQIYIVGIVNSW